MLAVSSLLQETFELAVSSLHFCSCGVFAHDPSWTERQENCPGLPKLAAGARGAERTLVMCHKINTALRYTSYTIERTECLSLLFFPGAGWVRVVVHQVPNYLQFDLRTSPTVYAPPCEILSVLFSSSSRGARYHWHETAGEISMPMELEARVYGNE